MLHSVNAPQWVFIIRYISLCKTLQIQPQTQCLWSLYYASGSRNKTVAITFLSKEALNNHNYIILNCNKLWHKHTCANGIVRKCNRWSQSRLGNQRNWPLLCNSKDWCQLKSRKQARVSCTKVLRQGLRNPAINSDFRVNELLFLCRRIPTDEQFSDFILGVSGRAEIRRSQKLPVNYNVISRQERQLRGPVLKCFQILPVTHTTTAMCYQDTISPKSCLCKSQLLALYWKLKLKNLGAGEMA